TYLFFFFFQAEDGIRDDLVTGVQTCALPISPGQRRQFLRHDRIGRRVQPRNYLQTLGCTGGGGQPAQPRPDPAARRWHVLHHHRSEERRVGKECSTGGQRDR